MTSYKRQEIDGLDIFYRDAGNPNNPAIALFHGFPSSSHMFNNLLNKLEDRFHLIAPDYPGFGNSDAPEPDHFEYTFDHLADVIEKFLESLNLGSFSVYLQGYGGAIGLRIAVKQPESIESLIIQNANAYEVGLMDTWKSIREFWEKRTPETEAVVKQSFTEEAIKRRYTDGARKSENVCPDTWMLDCFFMNKPSIERIQLDLLYDYKNNLLRYPEWHRYFKEYQPPTLILWGKNDPFFGLAGARAYKRDMPDTEEVYLDTGHFALEEESDAIVEKIVQFYANRVHKSENKA